MKCSLVLVTLLTTFVVSGCGGEEPPRRTIPTVTGYDVAAGSACWRKPGPLAVYGPHIGRDRLGRARAGTPQVTLLAQRPAAGARVPPDSVVVLQTWSTAQARGREDRCRKARTGDHDAREPVLDIAFTYFRREDQGWTRRVPADDAQEQRRVGRGEVSRCAAVVNARLGPRLIKGRETVGVVLNLNRSAGTARASLVPMSIRGEPPHPTPQQRTCMADFRQRLVAGLGICDLHAPTEASRYCSGRRRSLTECGAWGRAAIA